MMRLADCSPRQWLLRCSVTIENALLSATVFDPSLTPLFGGSHHSSHRLSHIGRLGDKLAPNECWGHNPVVGVILKHEFECVHTSAIHDAKTLFYLFATFLTSVWFSVCKNTGVMIFKDELTYGITSIGIRHQIKPFVDIRRSSFSGLLVEVLGAIDIVATCCRSVERLQHVLKRSCVTPGVIYELKLTCSQALLRTNARLRLRLCAVTVARVASISSTTGNPLSIIVYWLSSLLSLKSALFLCFRHYGVSLTGRVGFGGVFVSHPPISQRYLPVPNCLSLPLRPGPLRLVRFSFF